MEELRVGDHTKVLIQAGLPEELVPPRMDRSRVAILTQPAVTERAMTLARLLDEQGLLVEVVGLPDREEAKTLDVAVSVYEALASFGLSRHDTIVGVGGGAATDLAGYVAGTWLRGVEVVHYPTTLLASVDASLGGKTGVNLAGKNLVGVFWHPKLVVVDTDLLANLPGSLIAEGMAEAYKAGLVGDPDLCDLLGSQGLSAPMAEVVRRAAGVKARIVEADERESDVRAYLNFGHTVGHAVEFASSLSHGESVAVGMVAASVVSKRVMGFDVVSSVVATLQKLGLPTRADGIDPARVADLLRLDKKRDREGLRMVLLRGVADPVLMHVGREDIAAGLEAVGL